MMEVRKGSDALKHKIFWIILLCAAVILSCVFAFRDTILVHTMPKVVLSRALEEAFSALSFRFSGSPMPVLMQALDFQGRQNVDFHLDTSSDLAGIIRYDMDIRTQGNPARLDASGSVTTGGRKLDLSLFVNDSFAAVSSQELVEGKYYGITYDTFSQDIRSNAMLTYLIGGDTISDWENSVVSIRKVMSRSYTIPELTPEDIRAALYGIITMESQVETREMTLGDQVQKIHIVRFSVTGQEIADLTQGYADKLSGELQNLIQELREDPNASVAAEFYLLKGKIIRLKGELIRSESSRSILAEPGEHPESGPVSFSVMTNSQGEHSEFNISSNVTAGEGPYQERLSLNLSKNGIRQEIILDYSCDSENGDLKLALTQEGKKYDLRMRLFPTEKGFRLQTNDFYTLLEVFTGKDREKSGICTLDFSKGSGVSEVPGYRNFTQWSMEDMLTLLSGFGSLLGLKIG